LYSGFFFPISLRALSTLSALQHAQEQNKIHTTAKHIHSINHSWLEFMEKTIRKITAIIAAINAISCNIVTLVFSPSLSSI